MHALSLQVSDAVQVSYLLDHLYRSCKISQRQMAGRSQLCIFDPAVEAHDSLWRKVFPGGEMVNDENV